MRMRAKYLLLAAVAVTAICYQPISETTAAESKGSGMTAVVNAVTIKGEPKAVFDLITQARLWPQWHPATKAVGGVVERPYGFGDLIHERGRIGDKDFDTTWNVVEHRRPSKVVLQSQKAPTRITYTFAPGKVKGTTVYTRKLEYKAEIFASVKELEKVMRDQSDQGVNQLKALVERILSEEAKPLS